MTNILSEHYATEAGWVNRGEHVSELPPASVSRKLTMAAIGLLGRKVGMTQIFDEAGTVIPVTVLEAGPCHVLQLRTKDRDGYEAVQLGYRDKPRRLASRSQRGQVARLDNTQRAKSGVALLPKANYEPERFVREFRMAASAADAEIAVGKELKVDLFEKM